MAGHPNPGRTPAKIRVGSGVVPDGNGPATGHGGDMASITALAAAIPAALRPTIPRTARANQPVSPTPARRPERRQRSRTVLDRRAAERCVEQAARDALAARSLGPRLGSAEATRLVPGAQLTGDLLPDAVASLFAPR